MGVVLIDELAKALFVILADAEQSLFFKFLNISMARMSNP